MAGTIEFDENGERRRTDERGETVPDELTSVELTQVKRPKVTRTQARAAANMRYSGASYEEIADFCDYRDAATARRVVEDAIARAYPDESRESLFRLTSARLERLFQSIQHGMVAEIPMTDSDGYPRFDGSGNQVMAPNMKQLDYVKVGSDLIGRMMRLHGLEAPTQVQVSPNAENFERVLQLLTDKQREGQAVEGDVFEDDVIDADIEEWEPEDAPDQ